MYDLSSSNPNPVINYEGVSKNVTGVGFQEEGKWMYTGGEDCSARIWDLRYCAPNRTVTIVSRAVDIAGILKGVVVVI
jgi:WD40 repeat protein